jgi:phosphoenolpyruvate carboxykinase (GTP)
MVAAGTFTKLNPKLWPGCYYARSDANDVARVEDRTYICSLSKEGAGPTNNWVNPFDMRKKLRGLFHGSMRGRTMYVLPYSMGPVGGPMSQIGVELTGLPLRGRQHAHHGAHRPARSTGDRQGREARRPVHPFGRRAAGEGRAGRRVALQRARSTSCTFRKPARSGATVLATAATRFSGKKCFALRIASNMARDEGWMAEHMLILGVEDPHGEKTYVGAAFPSACGKTNFAMLIPPKHFEKGWKIWTVGDDIAWIKPDADGPPPCHQPRGGLLRRRPGHVRTRRTRTRWPRSRRTPSSPTWR